MIYDTDVLIWALRGNPSAGTAIDQDGALFCSSVSMMEMYYGAKNKKGMLDIHEILRSFTDLSVNESICQRALEYMEEYALRINMDPMDALIAATAVEYNLPLCTGNIKHFRHIPNLQLRHFRP